MPSGVIHICPRGLASLRAPWSRLPVGGVRWSCCSAKLLEKWWSHLRTQCQPTAARAELRAKLAGKLCTKSLGAVGASTYGGLRNPAASSSTAILLSHEEATFIGVRPLPRRCALHRMKCALHRMKCALHRMKCALHRMNAYNPPRREERDIPAEHRPSDSGKARGESRSGSGQEKKRR